MIADDEDIVTTIQLELESHEYAASGFTNPERGVEVIRNNGRVRPCHFRNEDVEHEWF